MTRILLYTGGTIHHKNLHGLRIGCRDANIDLVESNDTQRWKEDWDLVLIPSGYFLPTDFPNAKKLIYGPHNWVFPEGKWITTSMNDSRCSYNLLSPWIVQVANEFGTLCCEPQCYPIGVDIHGFPKKETNAEYEYDCFIYVKRRHSEQVEYVEALCKQKGLRYKLIRYGSYSEKEYKDLLQSSKFGIWLGSHESQGFGLQEALATNTPLLVWNVTSMYDEVDAWNRPVYAHLRGTKDLFATSVPYWSEQCGILVEKKEEIEYALDKMIHSYESFSPREYIVQTLRPSTCIERMLF